MITEWFIDFFDWLLGSVLGVLPSLSGEQVGWLYQVPGQIAQIASSVGKLSPVIPFAQIVAALGIFISLCVVAATFQTVRIAGSFVTLGGGGV